MSGGRRAWLDACPGERRGVVTLDGRPEHLFIEREDEDDLPQLGERWRVRLGARSPDRREAFVDLGQGATAVLRLPADAGWTEGAVLDAEVAAEPQGGKSARLAVLGAASGGLGRTAPGPSLEARLQALAPGSPVETGADARELADLAEEAALAVLHPLRGGVTLAIEPTRGMTVVDVDLKSPGERGPRAQDANLRAIRHAARLLRLKALGGTVAMDLIGFPKATGLILAKTQRAFAPDGPEVSVAPPNRFGALMLSLPRRRRPVIEQLLEQNGALSPRSRAQRLVRALEREGAADPGALLQAVCPPAVASALQPLAARLGPRYGVRAAPGLAPDAAHIERR